MMATCRRLRTDLSRHNPAAAGRGMRRRRAAGFTVIELMIAAFIALIIFGIGLMLITGATNAHNQVRTRIRTNDKARMFFEQFERDLSGAYTGHYRRDALVQTLAQVAGTYACMTTTTEGSEAETEYQSVRYYVVSVTKRLCREEVQNQAFPGTVSGSPDSMLCSDVEELVTSWAKWVGTTYQPASGPSDATHLLVKLTLLDPNEELAEDGQQQRIYQVYVPIPDGLEP